MHPNATGLPKLPRLSVWINCQTTLMARLPYRNWLRSWPGCHSIQELSITVHMDTHWSRQHWNFAGKNNSKDRSMILRFIGPVFWDFRNASRLIPGYRRNNFDSCCLECSAYQAALGLTGTINDLLHYRCPMAVNARTLNIRYYFSPPYGLICGRIWMAIGWYVLNPVGRRKFIPTVENRWS